MAIRVGSGATLEINGRKIPETVSISISTGNHIESRQFDNSPEAINFVSKAAPSIEVGEISVEDFRPWQTNHVKVTFAPVKRWVFPDEPFVEYHQSDEAWCRYFGIGSEEKIQRVIEIPDAYPEDASYEGVRFVGAVKDCEVVL